MSEKIGRIKKRIAKSIQTREWPEKYAKERKRMHVGDLPKLVGSAVGKMERKQGQVGQHMRLVDLSSECVTNGPTDQQTGQQL